MVKGVYHNLEVIFFQLNDQYFQNEISSAITWGKWGNRRKTNSIRLGSYDSSHRLIIIHPALDQASVPRLCVQRIVYHEMLHQKYPVKRIRGRNRIHTKEFNAAERLFAGAEVADEWFSKNLDRILAFKPAHLKNWLGVS